MFCNKCGTQVMDGQTVCPNCGNTIVDPRIQSGQMNGQAGYQNQMNGQGYQNQMNGQAGYQNQMGYQNQGAYGQGYQNQMNGQAGYQNQMGYQNQGAYGQGYQNQMNGQAGYQNPMGAYQMSGQMSSILANHKMITMLAAVVGSVLAAIGCFMPFYKVSLFGYTESMSFAEGDGVGVIVLCIIAIALAVIPGGKFKKWSVIPSGISFLITVYDLAKVKDAADGIGDTGAGVFFIILGLLIAIAGGVLTFLWKDAEC